MTTSGRGRAVELQIDDLVVHGVAASDSDRLLKIIERELKLLFEVSAPRLSGRIDLEGGTFEISAGRNVEDIGKGVARTIWESSQVSSPPATAVEAEDVAGNPIDSQQFEEPR